MTPQRKTAALIAGFSLLAVIAVAGWTRTPGGANIGANQFASPAGVYANDPSRATYGQPGYQPIYGQPASSNGPVQQAAYDPAVNCAEPIYTNAAYAPAEYSAPRYRTYNRPRVVRTRYVEDREVVRSRRGRSTGKSVAIVAGSAAAGAGIGALAGGGKGAAIGALSGVAAGFIFDRLTHNR